MAAFTITSLKAKTKFHPFKGIDRDNSLSQSCIQFSIPLDIGTKTNWNASDDCLHNPTDGITITFDLVNIVLDFLFSFLVDNRNFRLGSSLLNFSDCQIFRNIDFLATKDHDMVGNLHIQLSQEAFGYCTNCHPHGGFTS
ncbi:Uncharacterised protein [Streptococcus pneumoniae]|nr:Uncharacterised protein [Streptococcus pneumoniae]